MTSKKSQKEINKSFLKMKSTLTQINAYST